MGEIVRTFKAVTAYQIRHSEGTPCFAWQADYYATIIRSETVLQQVRRYMEQRIGSRKPLPDMDEIRRQLGWNITDIAGTNPRRK